MRTLRPSPVRVCMVLVLWIHFAASSLAARGTATPPTGTSGPPFPILFVTQIPIPQDFTSIGSVFGNHKADMQSVGRGGDLWIRYPDGTLKNLTAAAGYGNATFQGAQAIAVRDPSVHWDGTKAVFSMVIGAPTQQYQVRQFYWQLYEITGLGPKQTPVITKVPHQPDNVNNISPLYGTDERILFTSDLPRHRQMHLYPQLDEYELAPTNSGVWSLDPTTGDLFMLDHAPSGDFTPILDSFGRVILTRWDHMQRDQEADDDAGAIPGNTCGNNPYGTFNYTDESASAVPQFGERTEVFPEPRSCRGDLLQGTNLAGHSFNHFFPWQLNEDGTEAETLNHIGRQELHGYIPRSIVDDPNLIDYYGQYARYNTYAIESMLQIKEDPLTPGQYYGTLAAEFGTHAAGQIVRLNGAPTVDADHMRVTPITDPSTANPTDTPGAQDSGLYREPLPLSDGTLVAVHTAETRADHNIGTTAQPQSRYDFRLKTLTVLNTGYYAAAQPLTAGLTKNISYWDPDTLVTYNGLLWELNPVEVRPRPRPARRLAQVAAPEQQILAEAAVALPALQAYLKHNELALVVSRNVTSRDHGDKQQPFNLRVADGGVETIGAPGKIYDVDYIQFFQGDQLRGLTGGYSPTPRPGRRVLAQPLHDDAAMATNPPNPTGPVGSSRIAQDGSMAAFVPARRAMTWQLTDSAGEGVVRERYWVTFQPGEIRVCASCHGVNQTNQAGKGTPQNPPEALRDLLFYWRTLVESALFADGFETGNTASWSAMTGDASTVQATSEAALDGVYGLKIVVAGQAPHYLFDTSPTAAAHYRARFLFDPNSIPMHDQEIHVIVSAEKSMPAGQALGRQVDPVHPGTPVVYLLVRRTGVTYQLCLLVRADSAAWIPTAWATISDAAHKVEFEWQAATAPGAADGYAQLWIDDALQGDLRQLDNDTWRIDQVRLGAISGMYPATQGSYFFDAFASWQ